MPTIGIKRAAAILEKEGCNWKAVLDTFISKGMTEDDALKNARLAKILQFENFDHDANIPILWIPTTSSNGVDSGTKLQVEASGGSAA